MQPDKQNPFESISMEWPQEGRALRTGRPGKRARHRSVGGGLSRIQPPQAIGGVRQPSLDYLEPQLSLSDQFAHNVAVYPRDRMVINDAGAFIPRSRFGQNEEIMRELRRGGVFS